MEDEVRAACLLNFAHFVSWPDEALVKDRPFVIGVLGHRSGFSNTLEKMVAGEMVKQHPIVVESFADCAAAQACQILYVPESFEDRFNAKSLAHAPVLTVDETDLFLEKGGIARLGFARGRIKIKINLAAAEAASLRVSSKLLRFCEIATFGPLAD
jgi:uncharacterized protein DUF4154